MISSVMALAALRGQGGQGGQGMIQCFKDPKL